MDFQRLVIDTLKQSLSDLLASGDLDMSAIGNNILQIECEIDRRIIEREPHGDLDSLREDLLWLKHDLLGNE